MKTQIFGSGSETDEDTNHMSSSSSDDEEGKSFVVVPHKTQDSGESETSRAIDPKDSEFTGYLQEIEKPQDSSRMREKDKAQGNWLVDNSKVPSEMINACHSMEDGKKKEKTLREVRFAPSAPMEPLSEAPMEKELTDIEIAKKMSLGISTGPVALRSERAPSPYIPRDPEENVLPEDQNMEKQHMQLRSTRTPSFSDRRSIIKTSSQYHDGDRFYDTKMHGDHFYDTKMPPTRNHPLRDYDVDAATTKEEVDMMEAISKSLQESDPYSSRAMTTRGKGAATASIASGRGRQQGSWLSHLWPRAPPAPPRNDRGGRTIAQGVKSQYTYEGGQVACTSICLVAAQSFLTDDPSEWEHLQGRALDHFVEEGIARHFNHGKKHSSVEQLWGLQLFADVAGKLEMGCPFQGSVANRNHLRTALQRAHEFAFTDKNSPSLAVVFTKSGETILCINSIFSEEWMLMDSHGQSHEKDKRIYLKSFSSLDAVVAFLAKKYPAMHLGDGSFQSEMYDMFETFPIIRRESRESNKDDQPEEEIMVQLPSSSVCHKLVLKSETQLDKHQEEVDKSSSNKSISSPKDPQVPPLKDESMRDESNPRKRNMKDPPMKPDGPESEVDSIEMELEDHPRKEPPNSSSEEKAGKQSGGAVESSPFFVQSDYEDPVTCQIMADPVTCKDGQTYERSVIERWFRERVQEEEKRRRKEQEGEDQKEDDTCCGAQRPIQLTSPVTGKEVSGDLVPNHTLAQQIVRLMEVNAFKMSNEEIEEWKKRRNEKHANDRKREELEREEQARVEERRRNAEEAEKRNRGRSNDGTAPADGPGSAAVDPSQLVRLDREVDNSSTLSTGDTGLSCALGKPSTFIPREIAMTNGILRCMVHRCTTRLGQDHDMWCSRCGRLVCEKCLAFGVTDIQSASNTTLRNICVDCITQIADVMDSGDIHLQQKRVVLTRTMESRHSARFSSAASRLQDVVVLHDVQMRHAPDQAHMEETVYQLEVELARLKRKVRQASERASAAREDNPHVEHETLIERLTQECSSLEQEFATATENEPPEAEEEAIRYFESFSDISFRLESARMELATALSNGPPTRSKTKNDDSVQDDSEEDSSPILNTPAGKIKSMEREYAELKARYDSLLEEPEGEHEEEAFNRAVEVSALQASLEEVQTRLVVARSEYNEATSKTPDEVTRALEDLEALGKSHDDWPLPLGLSKVFPTSRMEQQMEILQNTLELRRVESERAGEEEWANQMGRWDSRQDELEAEIASTRATLEDAERDAKEEERQAQVRAEERRQRELARLERERVLREQALKAERERAEMVARHRREEDATRDAFARAAGDSNNGAQAFGGSGDLRMCKRCRAGPIENKYCTDLAAHNDSSSSYKGETVRAKSKPNHCPHCDWFDANWHNWPYWDGVYGPH